MARSKWLDWQPGGQTVQPPQPEPAQPGREYCGHKVERVIWETGKAVIFQNEQGRYWRYIRNWRQTWPVTGDRDQPGKAEQEKGWKR